MALIPIDRTNDLSITPKVMVNGKGTNLIP